MAYLVTIESGGFSYLHTRLIWYFERLKDAKDFIDTCFATAQAKCDFEGMKSVSVKPDDSRYCLMADAFSFWENGEIVEIK